MVASATGSTEAGGVVGLLAVAVALVVGVRLGVMPFHLRVPRLADVAPPISLPLLLAWIPVPLVVAALAISDRLLAPLALPLDGERALIVGVALLTLVTASLAAWVQDDLRHTVGYLVIADAGLVLLGFAALDPAAWGPTRTWLVAMAASKTALAAWAAVAEDRFATRSVPDLRGWLRHSPILGAGFALATVATFGLPGWVAFNARIDLAELAAGPPVDAILVLAAFATLPTYLRLLAVGTGPATSRVRGAAPERFVRGRRPFWQRSAPVAPEPTRASRPDTRRLHRSRPRPRAPPPRSARIRSWRLSWARPPTRTRLPRPWHRRPRPRPPGAPGLPLRPACDPARRRSDGASRPPSAAIGPSSSLRPSSRSRSSPRSPRGVRSTSAGPRASRRRSNPRRWARPSD